MTDKTITHVWLCADCVICATNGAPEPTVGFTPLSKFSDVEVSSLNSDYCFDHYWKDGEIPCVNCEGHYGADDDDGYMEFAPGGTCDGCESTYAGTFYRFALLSEG